MPIAPGSRCFGYELELSRMHGGEAYPWLKPGDRVRLEAGHLGGIEAEIVPGAPVVPLR